ncbi:MAG: aminotransferase class III-fold pyridoxal phosphate-dependent enzyme [Polyangiaceae bacterium]|nr:aminotransferase class III-fold pyridoxal phosphate-dependent enzyme [Polyangiaceae bacterium]
MGQSMPAIRVAPPGPRSREMAARLAALESPSFDARREARARASGEDQAPIVYAEGDGPNVVDVDGNRYVDLAAGFGALVLGHRPRAVRAALDAQSERLWLALGDVYASDSKLALCERLARSTGLPGARVMLGSSGGDAVTAALKTAVLATGRPGVIAFEGAYHGLSHGPLAACGLHPGFREPFAEQLNAHVAFVPYPHDERSLEVVRAAVAGCMKRGQVGAVLVEPVLGRGGCVVPPRAFLPALRELCDRSGALLICDEVWTGLGRSGHFLASAAAGVLADIVCLGKGLGGGLPISACVATGHAMAAWGAHGGGAIHTATHFGSPLACAAAVAVLGELEAGGWAARSEAAGTRWMARLRQRTAGRGVLEVRGSGLMVGVVLAGGAPHALSVMRRLLGQGWIALTGGAAGDVLTLTPPLDIDDGLLDAFADTLAACL